MSTRILGEDEIERCCRLDWEAARITWTIRRFRAVPAEQEATIAAAAGDAPLAAPAFDGPLRAGFDVIGDRRRRAEPVRA